MRSLKRAAAAVLATAVASTGAVLFTAGTANAAVLGPLSFAPTSGAAETPPSVTSSGPCLDPAVSVRVVQYGGSAEFQAKWPNGRPVVPSSDLAISLTDPMTLPFQNTFFGNAQEDGIANMAGTYQVKMECTDIFGITIYDSFDATLTIVQPGGLSTIQWSVQQAPPQDIATTTSLAVSPAGPVDAGTEVTLTASVAPAASTGEVQFTNGGAPIGSPVAVSGGTAVLVTSALPVGSLSLGASFNGSGAYLDSSASPVSLTVNATPAQATTTALAVSGGTASQKAITWTATVSPSGAAGTVEFKQGATVVGSAPVSGGVAALTKGDGLAAGSYSFSASFVPSNPAQYLPSDSAAVSYTVEEFAGASVSQTIQVDIPAGALTITVADNTPVVLQEAALNPEATLFLSPATAAQNKLKPITVTDTRAGNPGWTVSGQATDFSDGAAGSIEAGNLGWQPQVIDANDPVQVVTAGPAVPAGNGLLPGDASGAGLSVSRTLASSPAGQSLGTAQLTAALELKAPTTTTAGTYTSVLTLTAI